ncbi:MAG: choice-of-anchor D domain-containing protein [Verrucomicrobiota bacterium]
MPTPIQSRSREVTQNPFVPALFRHTVALLLMTCAALATPAKGLEVTFNAATEVPVAAASYTAGGQLNFTLGFAPAPGTNLTVVKNTGLRFITGQFSNLPNGATVNLTHNGITYPFVTWYYGGEGNNDLVLLWPYTGLAGWGNNGRGQLGDKSNLDRQLPVSVDQTGVLLDKTIVQVASGADHSIALCSDGTLAAWGGNAYGQLGNNSTTGSLVPVQVNATTGTSALAGKTVVAIAAGYAHSLALCSDGAVVTWSDNLSGQLGDNSTTSRFVPVAVNRGPNNGFNPLSGKTVVVIAAGAFHSLALCSDGTLAAWGRSVSGEVGDGRQINRTTPVQVNMKDGESALAGKTVTAIAAGIYHNLALCSDGTLAAWGSDTFEQLGNNNVSVWSNTPINVNRTGQSALAGRTVVAIAAGNSHSLALCSDGTLAAWGSDYYGELGDNDPRKFGHTPTPKAVNATAGISALAGKAVVAIAAGYSHNLALCSDGTAAAWGRNTDGQLGDDSVTNRYAAVTVNMQGETSAFAGQRANLLSVSSSASHSIAVYGTTPAEIEVKLLGPVPSVLADHASTVDFGSVIAAERTFRVRNTGRLALGNLSARLTGAGAASFHVVSQPLSVLPLDGETTFQIAFTGETSGTQSATLEITSNDRDEPSFRITLVGTKLATLTAHFSAATDTPLTALAINLIGVEVDLTLGFAPMAGTNLTVIRNMGPAFISGQFSGLPNGATVNLTHEGVVYPFVVWYHSGPRNKDLMLLWPHTRLAAWGENSRGALGDNHTKSRTVPGGVVQSGVLAGRTIVQVVRGGDHSLALCSDGTVAAWGSNEYGQLGDDTTTDRLTPVAVNTIAGTSALAGKTVVVIAAGSSQSLALCSDGSVAAWGGGGSQQLRVPTTVDATGASALAGKTVTAITAGGIHNLALCSDGTVAAWDVLNLVPMAVSTADGISALAGKAVVAIAASAEVGVALCTDGTVAFWTGRGYPSIPQLVNKQDGVSALTGKTVVSIAAGTSHYLALCSDGKLVAWGDNTFGQLGQSSTVEQFGTAVAVDMTNVTSALAGRTVTAIAVGAYHNLALCSDGTLAAWGNNAHGQLGDNSTLNRRLPVMVTMVAGQSVLADRRVSQLSPGSRADHNLVIYGLMDAGAPQIAVCGNGQDILPGDTTPDASDLTDFGRTTLVHGQVTRSFTIVNDGNVPLNLSSRPLVTFNGPGADAFAVIHSPAHSVVPGGSTSFGITFDPTLPGLHTATVTIQSDAVNHPALTFSIQGFGSSGTIARAQTITFAPPATAYLGQSLPGLRAHASSGLPVTLSVVAAGTSAAGAGIVGNVLSFTSTGTVKVQATQAGGGQYAAAPAVVKTITVKASPAMLTLLDLAQTYTGTARTISTVGGDGPVTVEYKVGTAFGSAAPVNAGSYPVRATDSKGTKTGTLVVAKAPLYIIPDDQRKFVGEGNPPLTHRYQGWVNGESESLVAGAPVLRTTATKASIGGVYPINASGGRAPTNYAFIHHQGVLVVDTFAATYEALVNDDWLFFGKLVITITAANTSFTGKLICTNEPSAVALKGALSTDPGSGTVTGSAMLRTSQNDGVISFIIGIGGEISTSIKLSNADSLVVGTGRRLLKLPGGNTVNYSGAHTAVLEPATPGEWFRGNIGWLGTPRGSGWATAAVSNKGVMAFAGRMGDGTPFTSSVEPDDDGDPVYRLFVQPYKTGTAARAESCLTGTLALRPLPYPSPALSGSRHVDTAVLNWFKADSDKDETYRSGFIGTSDPVGGAPVRTVTTVLMLDPWLPPVATRGGNPAITLPDRLGLTNSTFQVLHGDTGSALNGSLPSHLSLGSANDVTVTSPASNATKWKTKLVSATGLFSGSFELADTPLKPRVVNFTGVLRQPAMAEDPLIGGGHYLLPPLTGTEKTTGEIMFLRP